MLRCTVIYYFLQLWISSMNSVWYDLYDARINRMHHLNENTYVSSLFKVFLAGGGRSGWHYVISRDTSDGGKNIFSNFKVIDCSLDEILRLFFSHKLISPAVLNKRKKVLRFNVVDWLVREVFWINVWLFIQL